MQVLESVPCNLCLAQDATLVRITQDQQYDLEGTFHLVQYEASAPGAVLSGKLVDGKVVASE